MPALLLVHSDRSFLKSVHRLLDRRRVDHVVAEDERAALACVHEADVVAIAAGADIRMRGGLALLESMRTTVPLVGRFLIGPRIPADIERHVKSGLVHAHFSLPLDVAELLGYAGLVTEARRTPTSEYYFR